MPIKRNRKGRNSFGAKKVTYDGINFQSGLERYTYMKLKEAGLFEMYEVEQFEIKESFIFPNDSWEHQTNGKGDFINRGSKNVRGQKYTPDFTGKTYVIECKGRANQRFPQTWKDFKAYIMNSNDKRTLYMPKNQKDVDQMIKIMLEKQDGIRS